MNNFNTKECRKKKIKEYEDSKFKNVPDKGTWGGPRGNSKWRPEPGSDADKALKKYGRDGIEYRNGKPDFSPFVKKDANGRPMETPIGNMRGDHASGAGDFGQARDAMRELNSSYSIKRDEEGFTWHHNEDTSRMQLVDSRIHNPPRGGASHAGGASAVKDPAY